MSDRELQHFRRNIGVLLQDGALFTDLTVFENIATPVREHTDLPEPLIRRLVMSKLSAVGLGGIEERMPHELSGGMARRVAFARAVVLDPEIMLYDEPMTGLDPIAVSTIRTLMRETNKALGLTSLIVTHNVTQMQLLVDYCYIIASAKVAGEGRPSDLNVSKDPGVDQFMNGKVEGPIPFHYQPPTSRWGLLD
jgi:phospholipid/cholesterol/gamma-HCH transport system ATP-binding protein